MPDPHPCPRCGTLPLSPGPGGLCLTCVGRISLRGIGTDPGEGDHGRHPNHFGEFELLAEAGRGAMGVVYRARQNRLNRLVALKMVLNGQFAGATARRRFQTEAEAAARLDHPNIVPIYEFGEHEGRQYYVMRWVEGGPLEGRLDPRAAAHLLTTLARAVQHAHQNGVLHRDLKPGNILLDASRTPFITDFGLARHLDGPATLTATGELLGTPGFMAPEQADGVRAITTAADIWGLGAVLYFLLTGHAPFEGFTVLEVLASVREGIVTPPGRHHPHLDPDLETVCLKCLCPDPAGRYPSAGELADDLDRWLRHEPVRARPVSPAGQLTRWAKRRPVIATLALLLLLVGMAGLTGIIWEWRRAEQAGNLARRRSAELLALVDRLDQERAEDLFHREDGPGAAAQLARLLRRDPADRAAAERLLSALAFRPFLVPVAETPALPRAILSLQGDPPNQRLVTAYNQNRIQLFMAATGLPSSAEFSGIPPDPLPSFSPDGQMVALINSNGLPELRNANTAALLSTPAVHEFNATNRPGWLRFSGDGQRLLAAAANGAWGVLTLPAGPYSKLPPVMNGLVDADLNTQGDSASLVTREGELEIWDLISNQRRARHAPNQPHARLARFSPDGRHVAVIRGDRILEWRDPDSGAVVQSWTAPESLLALACGGDNDSVMAQGETLAFLWSARTGGLAGEPFVRRALGSRLEMKPSATQAYAVAENGQMRTYIRRSAVAPILLNHEGEIQSLAWNRDGSRLLSIGTEGTVRSWDPAAHALTGQFRLPGSVAAIGPDLQSLLLISNHTAWLYRLPDGELQARVDEPEIQFTAGDLPPTPGGRALLGHLNGTAGTWDFIQAHTTNFHHSPYQIRSISWSPDGRHRLVRWGVYISLYDDNRYGWWTNLTHDGFVADAVFSGNSKFLATASSDYRARLWEVATGRELAALGHDGPVSRVRFSPDGRWLATLSAAGQRRAQLWDATRHHLVAPALPHSGNVLDLDFSPDSLRLATAGDDGTVRLWDCATGLPISEPLPQGAPVRLVRFHPTEGVVAAAAADGRIRLWPFPRVSGAVAGQLPAFAEAIGGVRLGIGNNYEITPWPETAASLQSVYSDPTPDSATRWLQIQIPRTK